MEDIFFLCVTLHWITWLLTPYILLLIYQLTALPLLWSSLNWQPPPPPIQASGINEKFQCFPSTLTSFLRPLETFRHWHHFYEGARWRRVRSKVPPFNILTHRYRSKGGISCCQNIPLMEQIARKNVINVKEMVKLSKFYYETRFALLKYQWWRLN